MSQAQLMNKFLFALSFIAALGLGIVIGRLIAGWF